MHLANYIESHLDVLTADWIAFARRVKGNVHDMSDKDLKDLSNQLMLSIAANTRRAQGGDAGRTGAAAPAERDLSAATSRVARGHAEERRRLGFTPDQMVAEFRALRTSVTRRWAAEAGNDVPAALNELVRFNEAVNQALAESIEHYAEQITRTRDLFTGLSAHDLRSPVQAIMMSAAALHRVHTWIRCVPRPSSSASRRSARAWGCSSTIRLISHARTHASGRNPSHRAEGGESSQYRAQRRR